MKLSMFTEQVLLATLGNILIIDLTYFKFLKLF
jgi:hypothetical protein